MSKLSRILYKWLGVPEFVEYRLFPGWKRSQPFYRCRCSKHGEYEAYPQGWNKMLRCPTCIAEIMALSPLEVAA